MKPVLRIMICVLALAVVSFGCAGISTKETSPVADPLRGTVPESFNFNLRDAATRQHLDSADLDSMPPDRWLEVLLLRELARVPAEKDLAKVFDRLWEEQEEIKELVRRGEKRGAFIHPMVEVHYLLSAVPALSWQEEAADRIYQETLRHIKPRQLSGYALHFYTLALLKNGKLDAALPFLLHLEHFTSPPVYLQDLTVALACALDAGAYQHACGLMAKICRYAAKGNLEVPEKELEAGLRELKKAGKLEMARKALLPMVGENPPLQMYSFVRLLEEQGDTGPGSELDTKGSAVVEGKNVTLAQESGVVKQWVSSSHSGEKERRVSVEVQVIKASRGVNHIDPALAGIAKALKETLNFSNFTFVAHKTLNLAIEEKGEVALPRGQLLQITPHSLAQRIVRIGVAILEGPREIFHTIVESIDGGVTTLGTPETRDEVLLLRITTVLRKNNSGSHLPLAAYGEAIKNVSFFLWLC